jgi:diaminopimelate epimerase
MEIISRCANADGKKLLAVGNGVRVLRLVRMAMLKKTLTAGMVV